jgi:urease accessory protein
MSTCCTHRAASWVATGLILLTTPGATKFYLSAGETAIQQQVFNVADQAVLEWLPQENIFFPGAIVKNSLHLNLLGSARAAVWEIQCLGRPVINEIFDTGSLDSHWQVRRDNKPLLIERLRVDKDKLNVLSQLDSCPVAGTFIVSNADNPLIESLRDHVYSDNKGMLAMTLIDDLLIVRYLGHSTEQVRRWFAEIWTKVRKPCLDTEAVVPRIWNT